MKLSIIILNYNVRYFLELCLKSVQASIEYLDAEIIVVDNHSSDDSCNMVKSLFPGVTLIENKENYGFSKGNNQGVAVAKGEFICILNPDTVVAEDTFESLINFAENQNNLGILGCRLIDGSGKLLQECKRNIPFPKIALKKILGLPKNYYAYQLGEFQTGPVPILVGAFMLMKRKVFNQIDGFDEDYFMYGEDIDISYRIHKLGFNNIYNGSVTIIHFKGESTVWDKNYIKRFYGAMQVFYKKHFKSNSIGDILIWTGIKLAYLLNPKQKFETDNIKQYVLISDKIPENLESKLKKPIFLNTAFENIKQNTEVILDAHMLTYKNIIAYVSDKKNNGKVGFKILPKNSNFIIGSNSSKNRGEVIIFKDN